MQPLWYSFILLVFVTCLPFRVHAQSTLLKKKFNCKASSGTLPVLLGRVSDLSGVIIEYSPYYLNQERTADLPEGRITLGTALDQILAGEKVTLEEKNDKIILVPSSSLLTKGKLAEHYPLYGFIQEASSLEPLPFAVIRDLNSGQAVQSNNFGYYSLNLPEGKHLIQFSYAGYPTRTAEVFIGSATRMNLPMIPATLPEVKVESGSVLQKDGGSVPDKYLADAYNNFLGETDPVRSLYLIPGNVETQETTGKLLVRGGDPDQSLFLLDGNRVFNPSHLLGEISIINNVSVKSIRQFKNDFPCRFGDALSSITEVNTKDGSMDKWSAEGNAGFLAGALTIEGPIVKQRTALMASVRNSWTNPLLKIVDEDYSIRFYDMHLKITQLIGRNDKLMVSGYIGKDRLKLRQVDYQNLQMWGNKLATLNWNHVLGPRSFVNTTFNVSNYHNLAGMKFNVEDSITGEVRSSKAFNNYASIEQYEAKSQFELSATPDVQFRFGGKFSRTIIHPFNSDISPEFRDQLDYYKPMKPLPFNELALYYENEIHVTPDLLLRPGMHFTAYRFRDYNYNTFQPRLFASYRLAPDQQLFFSYSRMGQYLHQVTSPFMGINSEFWVPSTRLLRPVESNMVNLGYNLRSKRGTNLTGEIYYKKMDNVTNFAEKGNIFYDETTWEQDILAGKGWSYGAEILAAQRLKRWRLQLSYALAWSWRQFDGINDGRKYPFRYDRRHNLNVSVNYMPFRFWELSLLWYYSTGDWLWLPAGSDPDFNDSRPPDAPNHDLDPSKSFIYYDRLYNLKRAPAYHRLNFNTNFYLSTGRLKHKLSAGLYNAYQAKTKYLPDFWNMEGDTFNSTLTSNRIFNFTYYLSYTFSF